LLSRVRALFHVELRVRHLFAAPTIAGFGAAVAAAQRAGRGLEAPPIVPVPRGRDLPLSFAQQRLWFLDRLVPGSAAYNMALALRLRGEIRPEALAGAFAEIVRRHESLRTVFAERDGEPGQRVQPAARRILPLIDLSGLERAAAERLALHLAEAAGARPFDLAAGPLVRALLFRLDPRQHLASFTVHHIAADGWSMSLLVRELTALYRAFAA